jgi:hypothetical protein
MTKANKSQGGIVENLPPTTDDEYEMLLKTNLAHTQADEDAADEHIARKTAEIREEQERQGQPVGSGGHHYGDGSSDVRLSRFEENEVPRKFYVGRKGPSGTPRQIGYS